MDRAPWNRVSYPSFFRLRCRDALRVDPSQRRDRQRFPGRTGQGNNGGEFPSGTEHGNVGSCLGGSLDRKDDREALFFLQGKAFAAQGLDPVASARRNN